LPKLFGFSTDANGLIPEARAFVHGLSSGEAVGAAVAIGLVCLGLILALGRWAPRVPGVLVAVVVAIAAT
jgi:MFS superfamily sulfate permease-like transporter